MNEEINFSEIDEDLAAFQEDEMVQQALHRGVDLKKYARELERDLRKVETESVSQYVENNQQFVELHGQLQECDSVLARMEEMLHGFQADLGEISSEIKHLQDDSLSMSIKLKNRRAAEEKIHKFLDNSSVQPNLASNIASPHINEAFLEAVGTLGKRLSYLEQSTPARDGSSLDIAPSETYFARSLLPDLEKLKIKAVSKIREYFTLQFTALRKPKTNIQMVQQNSLLKYVKLFQFIQTHEDKALSEDLRAMYVESMGRTLLNLFKSYYTQLSKLDMIMATKTDLIAVEEATLKSLFTNKVDLSKKNDSFSLGERDKIFEQVEKEPILIHVAVAENQKYPFEAILRSILKHLIDASTNEFLFIIDFFKTNPRETFNNIFGRTLSLLLENIENYLLNCYDSVGLLLMIKLTHSLRLVMQRRRIPILDSFFDRISMLLWPRFKQVFDTNLKSVKTANAKKLGIVDLTPHYVSRRYAQLIASMITLQTNNETFGIGGGGENMIQHDMSQLRNEMIALLDRLSNLLPNTKDRKVFFINNYDQILTIFDERRIRCEESQKFEDLLMQQKELFAEEEIKGCFPKLISFVLQTEQIFVENPSEARNNVNESAVGQLVAEFSTTWKTGIQQINDDVLAYFANFRNGMEILKQVLTQLLLYYTRFQEIIKKTWSKPPSFARDIVSTATILMEIKRYSRTF